MTFLRLEGAMRSGIWTEIPAYAVANAASEALAWVLQQASFNTEAQETPSASYARARALLYLGVLAVRTTRAAMAVLASG